MYYANKKKRLSDLLELSFTLGTSTLEMPLLK